MLKKISRFFLQCVVAAGSILLSQFAIAHPGDLDSHFGSSGSATFAIPDLVLSDMNPAAVDQANRTILGLSTLAGDEIAAIDEAGSIDTTFGVAGFQSVEGLITDVQVDSKNRIVVVQTDYNATPWAIRVSRLDSNGASDGAFGSSGSMEFSIPSQNVWSGDFVLDSDDNILVAGTTQLSSGDNYADIAKIMSDGSVDAHFGMAGFVSFAFDPSGAEDSVGQTIEIDDANNIFLGAYTDLSSGITVTDIAKLLPDGTPDLTFGAGAGFVQLDLLPELADRHLTSPTSMTTDGLGNVLVAGVVNDFTTMSSFYVVRLAPDGSADMNFNSGTPLLPTKPDFNYATPRKIMIDGRGRIDLAGGVSAPLGEIYLAVYRLNNDGSSDTSFGDGAGYKEFGNNSFGGYSAFSHGGYIKIVGNSGSSGLSVTSLIGYDPLIISPPTHFNGGSTVTPHNHCLLRNAHTGASLARAS